MGRIVFLAFFFLLSAVIAGTFLVDDEATTAREAPEKGVADNEANASHSDARAETLVSRREAVYANDRKGSNKGTREQPSRQPDDASMTEQSSSDGGDWGELVPSGSADNAIANDLGLASQVPRGPAIYSGGSSSPSADGRFTAGTAIPAGVTSPTSKVTATDPLPPRPTPGITDAVREPDAFPGEPSIVHADNGVAARSNVAIAESKASAAPADMVTASGPQLETKVDFTLDLSDPPTSPPMENSAIADDSHDVFDPMVSSAERQSNVTGPVSGEAPNISVAADQVAYAAPPPRRVLEPQPQLRKTQRLLVALGFDPGPVDGLDGPRTRKAIKAYQRSRSKQATGRHSAQLLADLQGDVAARKKRRKSTAMRSRARPENDENLGILTDLVSRFQRLTGRDLNSKQKPTSFRRYCQSNPDTWIYDAGVGALVHCKKWLADNDMPATAENRNRR